MISKGSGIGGANRPKEQNPTAGAHSSETGITIKKADNISSPLDVHSSSEFAPRLLQAAQARDVGEFKSLVTSWVNAQTEFDAMSEGLLALSTFYAFMVPAKRNLNYTPTF